MAIERVVGGVKRTRMRRRCYGRWIMGEHAVARKRNDAIFLFVVSFGTFDKGRSSALRTGRNGLIQDGNE